MALLDQNATIDGIQRRVRHALYQMAFDIRAGTADEQMLYAAIFSGNTRFTVGEACLLAYFFSVDPNDLRVLGAACTDEQLQTCVDAIKQELIDRQNDTTRPVVGLSYVGL